MNLPIGTLGPGACRSARGDMRGNLGKDVTAMRRLLGMGVLSAALAVAMPVLAQSPQGQNPPPPGGVPPSPPPPPPPSSSSETAPATTTVAGDTGLWFVPTGEVLANKKFSVSIYRVNF